MARLAAMPAARCAPILATLASTALVLAACAPAGSPEGRGPADAGRAPSPATAPPAAGGSTATPPGAPRAAQGVMPAGRDATVLRIVDGDTLVLVGGERVRLTGIDTPETKHPRRPVECFGPQATEHLEGLLPPGTAVRLEFDVERTDRYGRTLAYVWRREDALHVNRAMLAGGYAQVLTVPPNVAHQETYLAAQREARRDNRGLWGAGCPT